MSYSFTDPATSSVAGKRYRRSSVTGPATGYTVTAANVITANYVAQWRLTLGVTAGVPGGLSHVGGGATATFYDSGTVLTLSATPIPRTLNLALAGNSSTGRGMCLLPPTRAIRCR